MDPAVPGKKTGKSRILVAPLDWGLGHATRCIPIIKELIAQGAEVILAGEGAQEALLRNEFPELQFLKLKGYRIRYGRNAPGLLKNLLYQTPKILHTIKEENSWLEKTVRDHGIHAVISDNRFGLYHPGIPCIFMTHQLAIQTPWGKWADQLAQKRNYSYIEKFSACWVPDAPGQNGLAGALSHPVKKPRLPVSYPGILSRFHYENAGMQTGQILILISGPEPQRTIFEDIIIEQISKIAVRAVIVRGLPGNPQIIPSGDSLSFYNHLPSDEMEAEIKNSEIIIARSGYSTVMDLARMKKRSILIPTPGQTEQEYLAKYLFEKKMAYTSNQKNFSLAKDLEEARKLNYILTEPFVGNELKNVVGKLLEITRNRS